MSSQGKMEMGSSLAKVGNRARDGHKIACAQAFTNISGTRKWTENNQFYLKF